MVGFGPEHFCPSPHLSPGALTLFSRREMACLSGVYLCVCACECVYRECPSLSRCGPRDHDSYTYNQAVLDRGDLSLGWAMPAPDAAASAKALPGTPWQPTPAFSSKELVVQCHLREQIGLECLCLQGTGIQ